MRRWLPYPLLSVFLLAMWLLLNQTLWPGHVLLGAALALGGGLAMAGLQPAHGQVRRPVAVLELAWLAFVDIVRSNIDMSRLVLNRREPGQTSAFVHIPLELRHPGGLAVLACILTSCPGTAWAGYDSAGGICTVHVLDLVDEKAWIETIRRRYERRLLEIFQ
jgi:multicomponent K+:H+ antiporter subunit E